MFAEYIVSCVSSDIEETNDRELSAGDDGISTEERIMGSPGLERVCLNIRWNGGEKRRVHDREKVNN